MGQQSAVFAGEGNTLYGALVNNIDAQLGKAIDIGLARAEVAAFDGVVEKALDAVAVVLGIFGPRNSAPGPRCCGRAVDYPDSRRLSHYSPPRQPKRLRHRLPVPCRR